MRLSHWNRGQLPSGRPQSHWVMLELVKFDMRGHKYQIPRIQRFDLRESIRVRDEKSSAEGPRSEQTNHCPKGAEQPLLLETKKQTCDMEVALNVTRCPTKPWPPDWGMLCSIGFPYVHFVSICPLDPQVCKPIWGKRFLNPQHSATQFKQRKVSKQVWEDMMVCFVLFDYREKDREQQDSIDRTTKLKNHSSMHQQPDDDDDKGDNNGNIDNNLDNTPQQRHMQQKHRFQHVWTIAAGAAAATGIVLARNGKKAKCKM